MAIETPIQNLADDIEACLDVGSVPYLEGPPGVGKTQLAGAIARRRGGLFIVVIGSLADPTDINGFPVVGDLDLDAKGSGHPVLKFAPRDYLLRLNREGGTLFFDELTCTPPAVLAALLTVICDRRCGELQLDWRKVAIIAAGNPAADAVNGQELPGPMLNRLAHYQFPVGPEAAYEWCERFPGYWDNPPVVGFGDRLVSPEALLRARSYVAGYIRRAPDRWLDERFKPTGDGSKPKKRAGEIDRSSPAFCTPRSWQRVSNHLALTIDRGQHPAAALRRIVSEIGSGPALEFENYINEASLPDPEALLANPDRYEPTGRLDVDFATMMSVTAAFEANATGDRYIAAWKVIVGAVAKKSTGGGSAYEAGMAAATRLSTYFKDSVKIIELRKTVDLAKWTEIQRAAYRLSRPFAGLVDKVTGELGVPT